MKSSKIAYSISISDIQLVAQDRLDRNLNEDEIALIKYRVGDYMNWNQAIEFAIQDCINSKNYL